MSKTDTISIEQITGNIGAVVSGIDMARPLGAKQANAVRQAVTQHGVIFFRDQNATLDEYRAFAEKFGKTLGDEFSGSEKVNSGDLSSTRKGTAVWHSDTTSLAMPPLATFLRAIEIPKFGGDTCWSSMYAAWEGLSAPMKRMLDGLTAVHSIQGTVDRMHENGMSEYAPLFELSYSDRHSRAQVHPVVITHPETGRKALYVSECFTTRIVELEPAESDAVLRFLARHIERPEFVVRWRWAENDVAFWDNRCVQHYAVSDYESRRVMQRIVLEAHSRPGEASALCPAGEGQVA